MPTLSFETFKDELATKISEKEQGSFSFKQINRSNGISYTGLIKIPTACTSSMSPVVNTDWLYGLYSDGLSFDLCVEKAIDILHMEKPATEMKDITNWEVIKDSLLPVLVPFNVKFVRHPHKKVADLFLLYVIRVYDDEDGVGEGVVTKEMKEVWNKSESEIHEQAMKNLTREEIEITPMILFDAVSNSRKCRGAVSCLVPDIAEKYKNCYIIPSSVHEVLFLPKSSNVSIRDIKDMVSFVNEQVNPEDILSYNIYEYVDGEIAIASDK